MKHIIAVNGSPRTGWNTDILVREAAGAASKGADNTLQVSDYERYDWTIFDSGEKIERREKLFPRERVAAFSLGANLVEATNEQ